MKLERTSRWDIRHTGMWIWISEMRWWTGGFTRCSCLILQTPDTTLEEFLEELDALTDAVAEECKDRDSTAITSTSPLSLSTSEEATASAGLASAAAPTEDSCPRTSEKRVRFSEESLPPARPRQTEPSKDSETTCLSSLNASSPPIEASKRAQQDQGGCPPAPTVAEQQSSESECTKTDSILSEASSTLCADRAPTSVHPAELSKCNSTSAGERKLVYALLTVLVRINW